MKKVILTETDRKLIISEKEKAILESFAKTFNKIKRIDENEISNFRKVGDLYQHIKITFTDDTKTKVKSIEPLYLKKVYKSEGPTNSHDYNNLELNLNSRQLIEPLQNGDAGEDILNMYKRKLNKPSTTHNNFDNSIDENELEY
jgi:hypothetical protein